MKPSTNICPFYIGQKIIAICNHSNGYFKKGDEFIILGIRKGICSCSDWDLDIGIKSKCGYTLCDCGIKEKNFVIYQYSHEFEPVIAKFNPISLSKIIEKETCLINQN